MPVIMLSSVFTGLAGGTYYNRMYFRSPDTSNTIAVAAYRDFWDSLMDKVTSELTWTLNQESVTINEATGQITAVDPVPAKTRPGGADDDPLPLQCQALIRLGTDGLRDGKRVRGKIYVPGLTESSSTNGAVTIGAAATSAIAALEDGNPVVYARSRMIQIGGSLPIVLPGQAYDVQNITLQTNKFASLSSRRD
uniref:Uncharacterized protein n=1 Tax=uncultured prokaryote TaxID=198431 RepID=A0A0H5Q2C6_9ZZZZ|nr:hypothetical protein [uncultured prokaryote]